MYHRQRQWGWRRRERSKSDVKKTERIYLEERMPTDVYAGEEAKTLADDEGRFCNEAEGAGISVATAMGVLE
jgi:hypothetical protein